MRYYVVTLSLFLCVGNSMFQNRKADQTPPEANSKETLSVAFCDLVTDPGSFENKRVRTRATYVSTFESQLLYDPKCPDRENYVWPMLDCRDENSCRVMREKLDKGLKGDPFSGMRAELVIVGRINQPRLGKPYGVQAGCRLGFTIERIEEVKVSSINTRRQTIRGPGSGVQFNAIR